MTRGTADGVTEREGPVAAAALKGLALQHKVGVAALGVCVSAFRRSAEDCRSLTSLAMAVILLV